MHVRKMDLFRYFILYEYGGIWSDTACLILLTNQLNGIQYKLLVYLVQQIPAPYLYHIKHL